MRTEAELIDRQITGIPKLVEYHLP